MSTKQLYNFLRENNVLEGSAIQDTGSHRVHFFLHNAPDSQLFKIRNDVGSLEVARARGNSEAEAAEAFVYKFGGRILETEKGEELRMPKKLKIGPPWSKN